MSKKPAKDGSKGLRGVSLVKDETIKELFNISDSCLYRWRKKKIIPYIKMGSTHYYLEDVIHKMLYLRGGKLPKDFDDKE